MLRPQPMPSRAAICEATLGMCGVSISIGSALTPDVQPAPKDHPWRTMKNPLGRLASIFELTAGGGNGMVPHYSGTTLDAQKRYADGAADIIKRYLAQEPQNPVNIIVENGDVSFECECLLIISTRPRHTENATERPRTCKPTLGGSMRVADMYIVLLRLAFTRMNRAFEMADSSVIT